MTDKIEQILQTLPAPDEKRLAGLEARVWQRMETSKPYAYFSGLPLWLKGVPIATALLVGSTIGASATPVPVLEQHELDVFSSTPSYSVSKIMVSCCD